VRLDRARSERPPLLICLRATTALRQIGKGGAPGKDNGAEAFSAGTILEAFDYTFGRANAACPK
jgi:hypothetical protein